MPPTSASKSSESTEAGTHLSDEPDLERIVRLQHLLEPESWRSETNPQGIGQIEKVGNFIFVRQRVRVMKQIENYFSWPTIKIMGMGGVM